VDETSPPGEGFLAEVCQEWEKACDPAGQKGIRVVHLRFGVLLGDERGAPFKRCFFPLKWGSAGC
jgi:NAD dependent epimerase/dehydratase family enzyme